MVARTSNTSEWTKWRDRPRDSSRSDETKRRAELWQAFCDYVHAGRGWITSSAGGRTAILETEIGSTLADRLRELGYGVAFVCQETRVTGASPTPEAQRLARRRHETIEPGSGFTMVSRYEITLPWAVPAAMKKRSA